MNNEFEGLVAIVTGGASGIGAAVSDRLAAGGAQVAILDLNPAGTEHLQRVAAVVSWFRDYLTRSRPQAVVHQPDVYERARQDGPTDSGE